MFDSLVLPARQGMTEPRKALPGLFLMVMGWPAVRDRDLAEHRPQDQQPGPRDCEETAHGQRERFEIVAHSPPALCRASAVALSAMILTIAAAITG